MWLIETRELREKRHHLKMAIIPPIFHLCAEGFEIEDDAEFPADVQRHVMGEEYIGLVLEKKTTYLAPGIFKWNKLLAFVSYRIVQLEAKGKDDKKPEQIIYFSAVMVAKEYRGRGIASGIIKAIMRKHGIRWMALRTQNPIMRESVIGACQEVYPSLSGEEPPEEFIAIGKTVADMLGMRSYDRKLMVEPGTYGKALYRKELPTLSDQLTPNAWAKNSAFWDLVGTRDGGSMIVTGRDIKE